MTGGSAGSNARRGALRRPALAASALFVLMLAAAATVAHASADAGAAALQAPAVVAAPATAAAAVKAAAAAAKSAPKSAPKAAPKAAPAAAAAAAAPPTLISGVFAGSAAPAPAAAAAPPAAGALAARGGGARDRSKQLRVGCLVPLSGNKANTGRAVQAAIEMAIRDQAPGLLPGTKVELACEDTKCSDAPALWGGRKLVTEGRADVMIGEVCSAASLGALGVVDKFEVPMVSPASTSPALSIKGDYFFRTVPSDRYQGQFAARKMLQLGAKRVVVAFTPDSYGQALSFHFIASFTRDGGAAFPTEAPPGPGPRDAGAVVEAVRKNNATGVFIATNDIAWGAGARGLSFV
ncbi:MAG: periplasmic binding protein-like I [Monoraphidium minutum]|nr:MAG: periplasmic binding protein-like I [Monoraphidium minutum]